MAFVTASTNLGKHIVGIQSYILINDIQTILRNINRIMMKLVRIKVEVTYLWSVVRSGHWCFAVTMECNYILAVFEVGCLCTLALRLG